MVMVYTLVAALKEVISEHMLPRVPSMHPQP